MLFWKLLQLLIVENRFKTRYTQLKILLLTETEILWDIRSKHVRWFQTWYLPSSISEFKWSSHMSTARHAKLRAI